MLDLELQLEMELFFFFTVIKSTYNILLVQLYKRMI